VARRIRVGPSTGRPCRRNAGGRDCVYGVAHSVASIAVALLLYPVVAILGGIPLPPLRACRIAATVDCLQFELFDRVPAGQTRNLATTEIRFCWCVIIAPYFSFMFR